MPDKDPILIAALWGALPDPVRAAIVGACVALVRVMYDDREPSIVRRLLECTLCGLIALCVASLVQALGIDGGYSTFLGGSVGLLGADQVRAWGRQVAQKRIDQLRQRP